MTNKYLERLDLIQVPKEYLDILDNIKLFLSSDEDLNKVFTIDNKNVYFCRNGEYATLQVFDEWDDECEHPILIAGF